jgi:outer membrane immunogenic protein
MAGEKGGVVQFRLIASLALLGAVAAGPETAIAQRVPVYSWTGCYVGIAGGGNWGNSQVFYEFPPSPAFGLAETNNISLSGGLFGGTTGCSYQIDPWVLGFENDISWTNKSGTAGTIPPFNPLTTFKTDETWLDTLRARFGYAWDRWFFYGTAGGGFAGEGFTACGPIAGCGSQSKSAIGWTAGVGVEYTFWSVLSVKLEYLHVDLGRQSFSNMPGAVPGTFFVPHDVTLTDEIFRVGLNYKFTGR